MNKPHRVVLIDDNHAWLQGLSEYLSAKGFDVRTAAEGREGLALLEEPDVRMAVSDYHMPGLNGLELLRQLRRRGRSVDVLLMSSDDDPSLPERAKAEGARRFLSKNAPPRQLLGELIRELTALAEELGRFLPAVRPSGLRLPVPLEVIRYLLWEMSQLSGEADKEAA